MAILRTVIRVLLAVGLLLFSIANWKPVEVRIWEDLLLETKLPVLVVGAFLAGLVPAWLIYRAMRWRLGRRIAALEASLASQLQAPPLATSTQLEAAAPASPATSTIETP